MPLFIISKNHVSGIVQLKLCYLVSVEQQGRSQLQQEATWT